VDKRISVVDERISVVDERICVVDASRRVQLRQRLLTRIICEECTYEGGTMQRKLTLSVEEELVDFGKDWARKHGKTLSGLLEDALKTMKKLEEASSLETFSEDVRSLIGLAKGATEEDYHRYLEEKYR
jgi:uncharacterized protein DUF6364